MEGGVRVGDASARAASTARSPTTSGRKVPLLAGRLGGSRLLLADLGPAVGAPAPGSGDAAKEAPPRRAARVIPDKKFDLPSLRAMDANVLIDIGTVRFGHRHPRAASAGARPPAARRRRADDRRLRGRHRAGQARRLPAARRPRQAGALDRRHAPARRQPRAVAAHQAEGRRAALPHRQARRAGQGEGRRPLDRRDPRPASTATCACTCARRRSRTSRSRPPASTSPRRSA